MLVPWFSSCHVYKQMDIQFYWAVYREADIHIKTEFIIQNYGLWQNCVVQRLYETFVEGN